MGSDERKMGLILGLTGSLGSGKSFVSSLFSRCGAAVICADDLAREAVEPGSRILQAIQQTFGEDLVLADGSLDRAKMAGIVFRNPDKRRQLERLIHPFVRERASKLLQEFRHHPLVILDVPLLFESDGYEDTCDHTVVVVIDEAERVRRLSRDRGMAPDEIERRLSAQMPQDEKIRRADFVIENSSTRAETARQVSELLHRLFPGGLPSPLRELAPEQI